MRVRQHQHSWPEVTEYEPTRGPSPLRASEPVCLKKANNLECRCLFKIEHSVQFPVRLALSHAAEGLNGA